MKVLFDTNLWISFMIGKRLQSLRDILLRSDIQIYVCKQLIEEIRIVVDRPKFEKIISKETRLLFFRMVDDVCFKTKITVCATSPIRDIKDLYLLSMAESVPVDYIVSGDKDLTSLKQHEGIPIVSYSEFLTILNLNF